MKTNSTVCTGLTVMLATACQADEVKPLPELPLTVEGIEAFADPKDVELLNSTSYYSKSSKEYIYRHTSILENYKPYYKNDGLVSWLYPGMQLQYREKIGASEWSSTHKGATGAVGPTWDREGHLVYENFFEVTKEDVEFINKFKQLAIVDIMETVERPFNISWLDNQLPLLGFTLHAPAIIKPSEICRYPNMQFIRYINSGLLGEFNTSGCSNKLETLFVSHSDIENLTVTQLPGLVTLNLFGSDIEQLQLDGGSLPKLKSLLLGEANLPSDLSQVQLPEGLVQLLMPRVTDNDLSRLQLPANLQYLDLAEAQLDDYSFIGEAKGLKHLSLDFSTFTQWHLLPQLTELRHLSISGTDFTDEDLAHLAGMNHLQTLNLGGLPITTAMPLKDLKGLSGLNLYMTGITDYNQIPFIENLSYFALPETDRKDLPEHIKRMQETTNSEYFHCNDLKPCTQPAWEGDG